MTEEQGSASEDEAAQPEATPAEPTALNDTPAESSKEQANSNVSADPQKSPPLPPGTIPWLLTAILLSLVFLIPTFILLKPASLPSARAAHAVRHGFIQLDNEEGALLFQAKQMAEGKSIYHPLDKPPYVAGTYTPLYMATVAMIDDFAVPSFSKGRVIVWICALGVGALLVLIAASATRNIPVGVAAGILFLATWEVYQWIGYFRVDFPAIFLSLLGLTIVVLGKGRHMALLTGALLMTLALFTKQITIAAPAACFFALLLQQPRRALAFAGYMCLWGIPAALVLQVLTGGEFFRHTILYNVNTWHSNDLKIWARHVWNMHRWFFFAGTIAGVAFCALLLPGLIRRAGEDNPEEFRPLWGFWQPVALYAIIAQWNFFGIAKAGSAENYLLEPIAGWALLICITSGALLRYLATSSTTAGRRLVAFLPLVLILGCLITHSLVVTYPTAMMMRFNPAKNPGRADFEASEIIRPRMVAAKNPLSELAIYHLQSKTDPVIQPFIMSELSRQGRWDQMPFVQSVSEAKYDVVIALDDLTKSLPGPKYTKEMLNAFQSAYELERILYTPLWQYHIFTPKEDPTANRTDNIAAMAN